MLDEHDDPDRNFLYWLVTAIVGVLLLALVIAGLSEKGEGAEAPPMPAPVTAAVQLRFFPLEGTGLYCIAAVTTQDAAPQLLGIPSRPLIQSFQWIECRETAAMKITPTPSPVPTKKVVG